MHIGSHEIGRDPAGVDLGQRGYNRRGIWGTQGHGRIREGVLVGGHLGYIGSHEISKGL